MAKIVVVDEKDNVIGAEEREIVKQKGLIHRIVRVIVKNSKGQIYLQKRGSKQETWPNRWDQSVGGHVDEGEGYEDAAKREMKEELGIESLSLRPITKFYHVEDIGKHRLKRFNKLFEVIYDRPISLAKGETSGGRWFNVEKIKKWMKQYPDDFTPGSRDTFKRYWKFTKE